VNINLVLQQNCLKRQSLKIEIGFKQYLLDRALIGDEALKGIKNISFILDFYLNLYPLYYSLEVIHHPLVLAELGYSKPSFKSSEGIGILLGSDLYFFKLPVASEEFI
jgi:hypothetical protein